LCNISRVINAQEIHKLAENKFGEHVGKLLQFGVLSRIWVIRMLETSAETLGFKPVINNQHTNWPTSKAVEKLRRERERERFYFRGWYSGFLATHTNFMMKELAE
jgi:hypothetical protein